MNPFPTYVRRCSSRHGPLRIVATAAALTTAPTTVGSTRGQRSAAQLPSLAHACRELPHERTWMLAIRGDPTLPQCRRTSVRPGDARFEPVMLLARQETSRRRRPWREVELLVAPVDDLWARHSSQLVSRGCHWSRRSLPRTQRQWLATSRSTAAIPNWPQSWQSTRAAARFRPGREGGAIEIDGRDTVGSRDCWVNDNRNPEKSRDESRRRSSKCSEQIDDLGVGACRR
jgi:hypothetical protein